MKYVPAENELVVKSENSGGLEQLTSVVGDSAKVEAIAGDSKSCLVRYPKPGDMKSRAKSLQAKLGKESQVYPLLLDPSGQRLVPTGQVRVRFAKRVDDKQLHKFAADKSLKFVGRDADAPEQATFQIASSKDYLLDVVERATTGAEVRLAWPETKGKYTKTG